MHDGTGDEHCIFQNQVIASADGPVIGAGVCSPFTGRILFVQLNGACFEALHKVQAFSEHDRRIFVALQRDSKPPNDGRFSWSSSLNL